MRYEFIWDAYDQKTLKQFCIFTRDGIQKNLQGMNHLAYQPQSRKSLSFEILEWTDTPRASIGIKKKEITLPRKTSNDELILIDTSVIKKSAKVPSQH